MRGELLAVWSETPAAIWSEIEQLEDAPSDLYCELYRAAAESFQTQPTPEQLADVIDNPAQSFEAFGRITPEQFGGEWQLVQFFERVHDSLDEMAGKALTDPYFDLMRAFLEKYSLRYDLRRPFVLCPTVAGIFTSLLKTLQELTRADNHLKPLMDDFEEAVRDLRHGTSESRIKTCIAKQMMLLEALGAKVPGVTERTLGKMCGQLDSWPHVTVGQSLDKLYGFACNYPGIRHGGHPDGAKRPIEMRDLVSMSVVLAGFTPYFGDCLDSEKVYRGS